jgi:hypothetical protein
MQDAAGKSFHGTTWVALGAGSLPSFYPEGIRETTKMSLLALLAM